MEKPRYKPPVIDMTKNRDSNDMFARDFVSRRNIEPCVKIPFDGDSNDMFAPCLRGEVVTANASLYSSIYARRSFGNVEFTPYVARSKIHKCFIVYFLLIFNLKPFQKQTPFRTLDLIRFIFLLAFSRFVFKFSEFHSHSLRDRPRGELTVAINGQCTC